jgi:hypothetical protein
MDIHPPEHPIRSVRDFLLQIFTVTCGIIIALTFEGLLEAHRHAELRHNAARDFAAELATNRARVQQIVQDAPRDQAALSTLIALGVERLAHQPTSPPKLETPFNFTILGDNAWQNALTTQALAQFDFDTAHALAAAYDKQAVFNDLEVKARDQTIGLAAYGSQPDALDDDEIRAALHTLRIAAAYQLTLQPLAQQMLQTYAAAENALKEK